MSSKAKGKPPKEINEAIQQVKREENVFSEGTLQAAAMCDKALKLFVESKTSPMSGIHEKYALAMAVSGAATVIADILAHSYNERYLGNVEKEIIKIATSIHDLTATIIKARADAAGGSSIIIPEPS